MRHLPTPPVVSQLQARLPDGQVDPARATDCGWACLSSALCGVKGIDLAPGCLREAAGLSEWNGTSTAAQIVSIGQRLGLDASAAIFGTDRLWRQLRRLRRHGRYVMLLGGWIDPTIGHWVLAYERDATSVEVMGPYSAERFRYPRRIVEARSYGVQVVISAG